MDDTEDIESIDDMMDSEPEEEEIPIDADDSIDIQVMPDGSEELSNSEDLPEDDETAALFQDGMSASADDAASDTEGNAASEDASDSISSDNESDTDSATDNSSDGSDSGDGASSDGYDSSDSSNGFEDEQYNQEDSYVPPQSKQPQKEPVYDEPKYEEPPYREPPLREQPSRYAPRPIPNDSILSLERQIQEVANSAQQANYAAHQAWRAAQFVADYAHQRDVPPPPPPQPAPQPVQQQEPKQEKTADDLMFQRAIDMLPSIVGAIEDRKTLAKFKPSLEMFKSLREMLEFLPPSKKKQFMTSKNRIMLDYIISRLSGKPGLYATVTALINSGLLQENPNITPSDKTGLELIWQVLNDIRELNTSMEDEYLKDALDTELLSLMEKIRTHEYGE